VPRLVVARPGEDERPDQRVAPRRARRGRQVQLARGVEERNDLVDAVEVDGTLLGGLELALRGLTRTGLRATRPYSTATSRICPRRVIVFGPIGGSSTGWRAPLGTGRDVLSSLA
jgi:hypothetical protein